MNEQSSIVNANMVKEKSYFNDQTTCITHSQSYFSSLGNDRSRSENPNNTTLNNVLSNNNISHQTNHLNSLYEEPQEESYIQNANFSRTRDFKKKLRAINKSDVLNNSSVP